MHRTFGAAIALIALTTLSFAAERRWQAGTWGDVTTKRRLIDFGPGASPFGRPGARPSMRAMADVRRFVIGPTISGSRWRTRCQSAGGRSIQSSEQQ